MPVFSPSFIFVFVPEAGALRKLTDSVWRTLQKVKRTWPMRYDDTLHGPVRSVVCKLPGSCSLSHSLTVTFVVFLVPLCIRTSSCLVPYVRTSSSALFASCTAPRPIRLYTTCTWGLYDSVDCQAKCYSIHLPLYWRRSLLFWPCVSSSWFTKWNTEQGEKNMGFFLGMRIQDWPDEDSGTEAEGSTGTGWVPCSGKCFTCLEGTFKLVEMNSSVLAHSSDFRWEVRRPWVS